MFETDHLRAILSPVQINKAEGKQSWPTQLEGIPERRGLVSPVMRSDIKNHRQSQYSRAMSQCSGELNRSGTASGFNPTGSQNKLSEKVQEVQKNQTKKMKQMSFQSQMAKLKRQLDLKTEMAVKTKQSIKHIKSLNSLESLNLPGISGTPESQQYDELIGMYKINEEDMLKHKQSIKRKEKQRLVRAESLMGMTECPEKFKSVQQRVFHNHEVTQAIGSHAARKATYQQQASDNTLKMTLEVAGGFDKEVAKLNRNFNMRLDDLLEDERKEQRRIEQKQIDAQKAIERKEQARLRKLKGQPFNFSTDSRAKRKDLNFRMMGGQHNAFAAPMSNLAYERLMFGKESLESGTKHGLLNDHGFIKQQAFQDAEGKLVHPKPFSIRNQKKTGLFDPMLISTISSTLPSIQNFNAVSSIQLTNKLTGRTSRSARPPIEKENPLDALQGLQQSRNHKYSRSFRSLHDLDEHVNKMYHNTSCCNRKNSCDSCQTGTRQHNWPDSKILRLTKIQPLNESSNLFKRLKATTTQREAEGDNSEVNSVSKRGSPGRGGRKHNLLIPPSNITKPNRPARAAIASLLQKNQGAHHTKSVAVIPTVHTM